MMLFYYERLVPLWHAIKYLRVDRKAAWKCIKYALGRWV